MVRITASESPGLLKPRDFAFVRSSKSASYTPTAISREIGVTWLSVEMSATFRRTTARLTPSRESLRATSASTISGVTTASEPARISRTWPSFSDPARNSTQAKESTIAINAIGLGESGDLPPKAAGKSCDYGCTLQFEDFANRLVCGLGSQCSLKPFELVERVPRDPNGSGFRAHGYFVCNIMYIILMLGRPMTQSHSVQGDSGGRIAENQPLERPDLRVQVPETASFPFLTRAVGDDLPKVIVGKGCEAPLGHV